MFEAKQGCQHKVMRNISESKGELSGSKISEFKLEKCPENQF